jgi:penicillin-binding protein 1A
MGRRRKRDSDERPASPKGKRPGQPSLLRRILILLSIPVFLALAAAGTLVGIFYYYGSDPNLPNLKNLGEYHPEQVVKVLDRDGNVIGELGSIHRTVVPYDKIPKVMIQALLAAEDAEYFQHEGVDYKGMVRAFVENVLRRKFAQGASTITQQVVKQMLLSPEKTMRRKVQEIILARRLSQHFSKEEVLALYLNQMYFGHGRYGVEEAARYFFGKSISEVELGEAAMLAGLVQSPERLSPYKHPDAAKKRQIYVLSQMAKLEYIYEDVAKKVAAAPIAVIAEGSSTPSVAPEAIDSVRRQLEAKYGADKVAGLGLEVKTTIDWKLQILARQALERGLEEVDQRHGFRGPLAHLTGVKLERKRAELVAERTKMVAEPQEREAGEAGEAGGDKAEGKHGKDKKKHAEHKVARIKPVGDNEKVEGIVEKVETNPDDPKQVRLVVFLGDGEGTDGEGVVDLAAEPRYTLGSKPLSERFQPGDVVRVRLAPERKSDSEGRRALALELGPQAAMVVLDPARKEVLALVGGYGYRLGGFDRSQRAHRQPGSSFKPFVYAAAIDSKRYTAASIVNDTPEVFSSLGWKPQNHDKNYFRGPVRLRVALADSINTVAVKLLSDVGMAPVRELASAAGIVSKLPETVDLSLALGTATVTPIEMASAYATFADGGLTGETRLITGFGDEPVPAPELHQAIRPETAYVMVSIMKSVVESGTARAAAPRLQRPAAGKTGTSDDVRDAWFVGFTPELLAAVWVGFDEKRVLGRGEEGARTALPIWLDFMTKALAGRPVSDFEQPAGVVVARIDPATGLLPPPGAEGIEEVFLDGTAPTETAAAPGEETNPDQMLLERHEGP